MAHLKQVASGLGLPFGDRKMTYNSRLAQEVGKWAESRDKGHEFHDSIFIAYFVDGQNIGKVNVLVEVAESINLSGKDALKIIQDRTYREAVDLDWERSYELRVTAVPTFLFNNQLLVGDKKYGSKEKGIKRLALHSAALVITHPHTKKTMEFEVKTPQYFNTLLTGI